MKYLLAVATAALLAGAAHAGSVTIAYSDADLATDNAASSFYGTLQKASRQACRDFARLGVVELRQRNLCRVYALDNAVADVGDDRLWAIHNNNSDANVFITAAESERLQYARIRVVKRKA